VNSFRVDKEVFCCVLLERGGEDHVCGGRVGGAALKIRGVKTCDRVVMGGRRGCG